MTQRVLVHGATGETGGEILDGLLTDGSFVGPFNLMKRSNSF